MQQIVEQAEQGYENRVKTGEARRELRRLIEIKKNGGTLMSVGNKKWKQAFYQK